MSRCGLALNAVLCWHELFMSSHVQSIAVVGGGPAGLRAAEVAALAGARVTLYERKPSVGRKFLVAGKSGLNLTNSADFETFLAQYSGHQLPREHWRDALQEWGPEAMREWARGLEVETFEASGGKVFPVMKKAAPLLRRWVLRLKAMGVTFAVNHRWLAITREGSAWDLSFETADGEVRHCHDRVILAMGGASWPQTGSDGSWTSILESKGISIRPLQAANCGWECAWNESTRAIAEGQPLHHLEISANGQVCHGELMVTRYGLEGTPMYRLGPALRAMDHPELVINFKPTLSLERMVAKMESARRDFYKEAQLRWKLPKAACAIVRQYAGDFDAAEPLARAVQACRIPLKGPRPVAEAISTAGGVAWDALDANWMLKQMPGVYCAGEMVDWEAPTGGFLLQACFLSGSIVGRAAADCPDGN